MKIAIKGHESRGKEVIQILKSLGGKSIFTTYGFNEHCCYYVNPNGRIIESLITTRTKDEFSLYTLEEFEKEFPFKIGDKVTFKNDDYPYTIKAFDIWSDGNIVCEFVENGLHYSINKIKPYKEVKEERNITLTIDKAKEWYNKGGELKEIALQAFSEQELNPLPRSWEDYCKNYPIKPEEIFIDGYSKFIVNNVGDRNPIHDKNICPSRKSAEAHLAMIQLEQLRNCWLDGWTPKWEISEKWCIRLYKNQIHVGLCTDISRFLTFPTKEMADEFLKCFRDLIEKAEDLI